MLCSPADYRRCQRHALGNLLLSGNGLWRMCWQSGSTPTNPGTQQSLLGVSTLATRHGIGQKVHADRCGTPCTLWRSRHNGQLQIPFLNRLAARIESIINPKATSGFFFCWPASQSMTSGPANRKAIIGLAARDPGHTARIYLRRLQTINRHVESTISSPVVQ